MNVKIDRNQLIVTRDDTDPKYYDSQWGSADSRLLYHVKQALIKMGFDVIKKSPAKDGHLTSCEHYLRDRKHRFCIIDSQYAIRSSAQMFNESGIMYFDINGEMKVSDK